MDMLRLLSSNVNYNSDIRDRRSTPMHFSLDEPDLLYCYAARAVVLLFVRRGIRLGCTFP
jgi:hypothetical protein